MKQEKIIDDNNLKSCFIKKVIKDYFVYFKQCCLNRREHTYTHIHTHKTQKVKVKTKNC